MDENERDLALVADEMVREVFNRRQPAKERLLAARGVEAVAREALEALRVMPHGHEWRWLTDDMQWRLITTVQAEALGWRLRAVRGSIRASDHPGARAAARAWAAEVAKAVSAWGKSMPLRQWCPVDAFDGVSVTRTGETMVRGAPCEWQLEDVEDRAERAAASDDWATWELCERALDGCAQSLDAAIALLREESGVWS